MIKRILVPLDGSVTAEAILPQVRRLVRLSYAEVILVRADIPIPVDGYLSMSDASLNAARTYLAGVQERLESEGVNARSIARESLPADLILYTAKEEGVELIAMATHGSTGLTRLFAGSVTENVLRESSVPVLAVRPFWTYDVASEVRPEDQPVRNILVPLDGSTFSSAVLPHATMLARLFGARVVLLRVLPPETDPWMPALDGEEMKDFADRELAHARLRDAARAVRDEGVQALALVEQGDAAVAIHDVCRVHEIDMIAMTTHGRSGLRRVVFGSVTEKVLREAKLPLLVVRGTAATLLPAEKTAAGQKHE